ncbi:MAG: signal peptidase I [Dorea sp.]|nr:signal peptidase I [Dorea sp.]
MDERRFGGFSRELPSPDELFHADEWEEQEQSRKRIEVPVQKEEKKPEEQPQQEKAEEDIQVQEEIDSDKEQAPPEEPAPKRKKSKLFSAGFIIGLLVLALIITNLSLFHVHLFCMMSESMGDTVPKGSIIISYEAPAEKLMTGDVITYRNRDGLLITHEIVSVISNYDGNGGYAFRTKGAANESEDEEAVTYGMVEGKALFYIPYIGKPFVK